jgi:hypothetical protein
MSRARRVRASRPTMSTSPARNWLRFLLARASAAWTMRRDRALRERRSAAF